jgi:hypothetical protein
MNSNEKDIDRLLALMEGQLPEEERNEVLGQVMEDPLLAQELMLLEQTRLIPDESVRFPCRERLVQPGRKRNNGSWVYAAAAVAAMIILGIFLYTDSVVQEDKGVRTAVKTLPGISQPDAAVVTPKEQFTVEPALGNDNIKATPLLLAVKKIETAEPVDVNRKSIEAITIESKKVAGLEVVQIAGPVILPNEKKISITQSPPVARTGAGQRLKVKTAAIGKKALLAIASRMGSPRITLVKEEVNNRTFYILSFENDNVKYSGKF